MNRADKEEKILQAVKESALSISVVHNYFVLTLMLEKPTDKQVDDMIGFIDRIHSQDDCAEKLASISKSIVSDINRIYFQKSGTLKTEGYAK